MLQNKVIIGDCRAVLSSKSVLDYASYDGCGIPELRKEGKVSIVYIDPPYNTRSKLCYNDNRDDDDWEALLEESIVTCHYLLRDDAVIFVSIDDNKYAQLKLLLDNYYDYLGTFITHQAQRSNAKHVNTTHEYVLCYAKDKSKVKPFSVLRKDNPNDSFLIDAISTEVLRTFTDYRERYGIEQAVSYAQSNLSFLISHNTKGGENSWLTNYNRVDEDGNIFYPVDLSVPGTPRRVDIDEINLHLDPLKTRGWVSDDEFIRLHGEGRLYFRDGRPYRKKYLHEAEMNAQSILPFYSRQGTEDLKRLGLGGLFDNPKPVALIEHLIRLTGIKDGVVLDFFAGSGSTGQAVIELNACGDRSLNYLLIQKQEIVRTDKVLAACEKYEVNPFIEDILVYRLKKVYERVGVEKDFVVEVPV